MTRHISEDTLLKHALGALDDQAERNASRHLKRCATCRRALDDIESSIRRISEVNPLVAMEPPPLPGARPISFRWVRMAAAFAAGIGLGALAANALHAPDVAVVRQQVELTAPSSGETNLVPRDGVRWDGDWSASP